MKEIIATLIFILLVSTLVFGQTDSSKVVTTSSQNTTDSIGQKPEVVFAYSQEMPSFPGGQSAFYVYLGQNTKYPSEERKAKKQGTVDITFTIERDGTITDVHVVKEVPNAPGFSAEAIRVISEMPNWILGKLNGKTVRVTLTQPVKFVLN